jgi:hypothetical protein
VRPVLTVKVHRAESRRRPLDHRRTPSERRHPRPRRWHRGAPPPQPSAPATIRAGNRGPRAPQHGRRRSTPTTDVARLPRRLFSITSPIGPTRLWTKSTRLNQTERTDSQFTAYVGSHDSGTRVPGTSQVPSALGCSSIEPGTVLKTFASIVDPLQGGVRINKNLGFGTSSRGYIGHRFASPVVDLDPNSRKNICRDNTLARRQRTRINAGRPERQGVGGDGWQSGASRFG